MGPVNYLSADSKKRWNKCFKLLLLFIISCSSSSYSQIFKPGEFIESTYPAFEVDSIKRHSIRSITIRQMRKPSGRPIYDDGKRAIYRFNHQGQLTEFFNIFPGLHGVPDTNIRRFFYDGEQQAAYEKQHGRYYKRIDFIRQNDSVLIERIRVRRGKSDWELLEEERVEVKEGTFQGNRLVTERKGGLNSKPYQRIVHQYDEHNRLITSEVWHGARMNLQENWIYKNDRLTSYRREDRQDDEHLEITYSTENALQDQGTWCYNNVCRNWSAVYYKNGLVKGWMIINPKSQNMEIWEFRYDYY